MKHLLTIAAVLCLLAGVAQAQTKPAPKKPAAKKTTATKKPAKANAGATANKEDAPPPRQRNASDNAPDLNKITAGANADTSHRAAEKIVTTPENNPNAGKPTMKLFGKTIELPSGNSAPNLNTNPK